ncbi:hypothetical protein G4B88_002283, partial [Cannabis sativa]
YTHMESLSITHSTLSLVLKACARLKVIEKSRILHFLIRGTSLMSDIQVGTAIVGFYEGGLKPNSHVVVGLLSACREFYEVRFGRDIHGYYLRNELLDLDPVWELLVEGFEYDLVTIIGKVQKPLNSSNGPLNLARNDTFINDCGNLDSSCRLFKKSPNMMLFCGIL